MQDEENEAAMLEQEAEREAVRRAEEEAAAAAVCSLHKAEALGYYLAQQHFLFCFFPPFP